MQSEMHQSESRKRTYPVLSIFDVTLNFLLSSAIFAVGCALLVVILTRNAPYIVNQICDVASHIFH